MTAASTRAALSRVVSQRDSIVAALLGALCCSSALAVVYSTHLSREAYAENSRVRSAIDEIEVQWSRLQIEASTFSGHERIERTARESLGRQLPGFADWAMIVSREGERHTESRIDSHIEADGEQRSERP